MSKTKQNIIAAAITAVAAFLLFYFTLPAINFKSIDFYVYLISLIIVYGVSIFILSSFHSFKEIRYGKFTKTSFSKQIKVCLIACGAIILFVIVLSLFSSKLFNASKYQKMLTVQDGNFTDDVKTIRYDQIPTLDKESAEKIGDRKMGEMPDLVSQFEVDSMYSQINYKLRPTRVTPLNYGDFFKWVNNMSEGIPAYIRIDMVTQEVSCVRLEEGMKYSKSDMFNRKINRHIRFKYPTYMFDEPSFEIDEEGNPYWICPRITNTIGLFGGTDAIGAVIVNAVSGECTYYDLGSIPDWVDRVFYADRIIEQFDYSGTLVHGFWNSIIGQKDVRETTDGYNYIALNNDIYIYTGITSVTSDRSNVGFLLCNQRTKETKFYPISGAEEYSAMDSAEGQVQHLGYKATFPLLLNISGEPTYFIALKDNAQLVKMYAMVNVSKYQCVATGETIEECEKAYKKVLKEENISTPDDSSEETASGKIEEIRTSVIDGNSYYFIKLYDNSKVFVTTSHADKAVVMLNVDDEIAIKFDPSDDELIDIKSWSKK